MSRFVLVESLNQILPSLRSCRRMTIALEITSAKPIDPSTTFSQIGINAFSFSVRACWVSVGVRVCFFMCRLALVFTSHNPMPTGVGTWCTAELAFVRYLFTVSHRVPYRHASLLHKYIVQDLCKAVALQT